MFRYAVTTLDWDEYIKVQYGWMPPAWAKYKLRVAINLFKLNDFEEWATDHLKNYYGDTFAYHYTYLKDDEDLMLVKLRWL